MASELLPDRPLLKVEVVAACFGVSVRTVRNWIKAGRLGAIRTPGGAIRIPREAVEWHLAAEKDE